MRVFVKRRSRSGQAVVELCFSIIMFTIMLAMIATLCLYLYMQNSVITAAREGARVAASDINFQSSSTSSTAITNVQNHVISFFQQTTGQTLGSGNISVTGPSGSTTGYRNMVVTVTYTLTNPINISGFMQALGAGPGLGSFNLSATATTRYEE